MPTWLPACGVEEIPNGRAVAVEVSGLRLAIFREGESIVPLLARCPHANGDMANGWIDDGEAVCPLHGWRFLLKTGRCTTARGHSLHRFACQIREGYVWVAV